MTSLSVVIPVYNAEKTIADLCRSLMTILAGDYRLEIVLVNDCSNDRTDTICKALQAEYPQTIAYARLSRNFGEHNAVMAGLNQARGDFVVIMDDDFQNPPEEVSRLAVEIQKGFDVVYCQYPEKRDGFFRNLGSYLNGSMARVILDKPANLYLSSFKAMNRFLVNEVITYKNPRPYLDAIILRITRSISTIEVRHDQRRAGRSGYTFKKLVALWGDMLVSYSLIPLRVVAILGILLTLLGCYSMAEMLIQNLNPMLLDPSDLEELTSVSLFFRGFQLFATGIVGEYVGRIYLKLNQEPQYIIREKFSGLTDRRAQGGDRRGAA
ncbi:MAG: glycosyltransferase family 2 protein [Desulfuromonadaceae bacterium]|nr:glycosyltransferase family 2 protein [Desulfuromonadaceae bacterium]